MLEATNIREIRTMTCNEKVYVSLKDAILENEIFYKSGKGIQKRCSTQDCNMKFSLDLEDILTAFQAMEFIYREDLDDVMNDCEKKHEWNGGIGHLQTRVKCPKCKTSSTSDVSFDFISRLKSWKEQVEEGYVPELDSEEEEKKDLSISTLAQEGE